jgi:hypothetical protein
VAYPVAERLLAFATGIESFEVRDRAKLEQRIGEADALLISDPGATNSCHARAAGIHPVRGAGRPVLARALKRQPSARRVDSRAARASL